MDDIEIKVLNAITTQEHIYSDTVITFKLAVISLRYYKSRIFSNWLTSNCNAKSV